MLLVSLTHLALGLFLGPKRVMCDPFCKHRAVLAKTTLTLLLLPWCRRHLYIIPKARQSTLEAEGFVFEEVGDFNLKIQIAGEGRLDEPLDLTSKLLPENKREKLESGDPFRELSFIKSP